MIELYDYQKGALEKIIRAFKEASRALAVMATGLGKTIVAATWANREVRQGRKGLFLCHDNGILDQAMVEFRKVMGHGAELRPFYGNEKDWDADKADVVFASFQTFAKGWHGLFHRDEFGFIIVDESHHGSARTFKSVIEYFTPKKLLGITATPDRMDEKNIRDIFGPEAVNLSLEEAIAKGWLTSVEYHVLNDHLSHWKLKRVLQAALESKRRVALKQLNENIFIEKRDEEIAETVRKYAGEHRQTIIFCENVLHADTFAACLPGARVYHSHRGLQENRQTLASFRDGSLQFIVAVDKFNEGIDIPDAEMVVFLRCTDSKTIFLQQLGRRLRKVVGKEKVIVLDFVANCERLLMVKEIVRNIKQLAGNGFELTKDVLHVSGASFDFEFTDQTVEILEVIQRINRKYIADFPHLHEEYMADNEIPADKAFAGSNRPFRWKCKTCGYEWVMSGHRRLSNKMGCPACAEVAADEYLRSIRLINKHPQIAEWYSENNAIPVERLPEDYSVLESFLWICPECRSEFSEMLSLAIEEGDDFPKMCPHCILRKAEVAAYREDTRRKLLYGTAEEAFKAAFKLMPPYRNDFQLWQSYQAIRKIDPKLPYNPGEFYSEWRNEDPPRFFMSELERALKRAKK